ncbi:DUF4259 domain-containing protein [Actinomadura verrucosospora]|uniref:DUF4259 domain-containing protein n=1 Tax=Actinomadura verrucosospora TaxID=46165 RepID=A0A7D4A671_ACTVE|nr:DUF4259 domain-containing protein [Actinomadura verrucosospora]QKG23505.1 hypothetical protein ACTIVE_5148 [Actinomadura verrucosospora]
MGTWDTSPFGNDTAADFAGDLDDLPAEDRPEAIRKALSAAVRETDYLDSHEGVQAVAAAAIVAAQCPNGRPVDAIYGPDEPVPPLPADLRPLALTALDQVVADTSELRQLWDDAEHAQEWRTEINHLRKALSPEP